MKKIILLILFLFTVIMGFSQAVTVIGTLDQKNDGTFPIVLSEDIGWYVTNYSDLPVSPIVGTVYYVTAIDRYYQFNGSSWNVFSMGEGLENQVAYFTGDNLIGGSNNFRYNDTDGMTLGLPVNTSSYINFLSAFNDNGDVLTIDNRSFLKLYGGALSCSSFGLYGTHGSFLEGGVQNVTNVGNFSQMYLDQSVQAISVGTWNMNGVPTHKKSFLGGAVAVGDHIFSSNDITALSGDHTSYGYPLYGIGSYIGAIFDSGSGNNILIGSGLFNDTDQDTVGIYKDLTFIGIRGYGNQGKSTWEIPGAFYGRKLDDGTWVFNFNYDVVQVNGVPLSQLYDGGFTKEGDTLSRNLSKQVVIGNNTADDSTRLVVVGNARVETLYANNLEVDDALSLYEDIPYMNVDSLNADKLFVGTVSSDDSVFVAENGHIEGGLQVDGEAHSSNEVDIATEDLEFGGDITFSGDSTKFTSIVYYEDSYWDDLRVSGVQARIGATSHPPFDYDSLAIHFDDNSADTGSVYLSYQMPHSWKEGTSIYFHIHWHQTSSSDSVNFHIYYKRIKLGGEGDLGWTLLNSDWGALLPNSNEVGFMQLATFPAISMTGYGGSSQILIKVSHALDGGTDYLNEIYVHDFDLHYEIDKPGSDNIAP